MNLAMENIENMEKLLKAIRDIAYGVHVYLGCGTGYPLGLVNVSPCSPRSPWPTILTPRTKEEPEEEK